MKAMLIAGAALALAAPGVAVAQGPAVHSLETAARMTPADGGAAIELANAYRRDNRLAEADAAYRRALALDNVMLETRLGTPVWSHAVARRALARTVTLAAR